MRQTISFDIDGVIAGGHYLQWWDRMPETYAALPVIEGAIDGLTRLTDRYNVYLVSGRRFADALTITRIWLREKGLDLRDLCGVIVGIPRMLKPIVIESLGSQLHFDDDPKVTQMLGVRGVWFEGKEWPGWEELVQDSLKVKTWQDVSVLIKRILG